MVDVAGATVNLAGGQANPAPPCRWNQSGSVSLSADNIRGMFGCSPGHATSDKHRGVMDKKVAGLIGAVTSVVAAAPAQAAVAAPPMVDAAMQAHSYADLLTPIPNALALLKASSASATKAELVAPASENEASVQEVQYHHHHHHHHYRRPHHHHHHHHHHHGGYGY
jgi:hypothetical protein